MKTKDNVALRFLIFDAPNDNNIQSYLKYFKKYHVKLVVRVSKPTYKDQVLKENNIEIMVKKNEEMKRN